MDVIPKPESKSRVIDLVEVAGFDVSDWANYKNGSTNPGANPRYCYEWCFTQNDELVLLCLWYSELSVDASGSYFQAVNLREAAAEHRRMKRGAVAGRALRFDEALALASRKNLPLRVVVCEGHQPKAGSTRKPKSRVKFRALDPVPWRVIAYSEATGACTITRGSIARTFVDQHLLAAELPDIPRYRDRTGQERVRSRSVRDTALLRANGHCEYCGDAGFVMYDGRRYLETHHLDPLSNGGGDVPSNVVALCADHHREAHYGVAGSQITTFLKAKISS